MASGRTRRSRETSFYDAAIGIYAIVVGLALFAPLESFASDVVSAPLNGDWGLRFMALGLFAEAVIWFHALTAEMALGSPVDEYGDALQDIWLGAGVVVLLVVLSAAIARGVAVFLWAFTAYALWDALWEAAYLVRNRGHTMKAWRDAGTPSGLLRQLRKDRQSPASVEEPQESAAEPTTEEVMWARATSYWLLAAVAVAAWSALWASVAMTQPDLADLAAGMWFVAVIVAMGIDYWLFPHFYTA